MGKFLLTFIMLWAYMHLSQFLIIWSGNLPEEIPWYLNAHERAPTCTWDRRSWCFTSPCRS